jgi:hypothetical protein
MLSAFFEVPWRTWGVAGGPIIRNAIVVRAAVLLLKEVNIPILLEP